MEGDELREQVDQELNELQTALKGRLKEANDFGDLNKKICQNSMQLEEHTKQLEQTAVATKWKWMMEYAKYMIIAGIIIILLAFICFRPLIKLIY
ncbi:hypothetical protein ENBRE01_0838 [Enteropsectra breve]|nr:hypothetical protein ENBRE01_0838 [Enteropsectra breve]